MTFKDILLVLITYPQATDASEIQEAVHSLRSGCANFRPGLHRTSSGSLAAPAERYFRCGTCRVEREKSSDAAAELSAAFEASAKKAGVFQETLTKTCFTSDAPDLLTREARLRDLTIVPAILEGTNYQWYAKSIVFGSGRPVATTTSEKPYWRARTRYCRHCMGWSCPAAREVADALPFLERAKKAHILTVLNEKNSAANRPPQNCQST